MEREREDMWFEKVDERTNERTNGHVYLIGTLRLSRSVESHGA